MHRFREGLIRYPNNFVKMPLTAVFLTFCFVCTSGCRQFVTTEGDSRIVYVTNSSGRGSSITCIEPNLNYPSSYKDAFEAVLDEEFSVRPSPDGSVEFSGEFRGRSYTSSKMRYLHSRATRIHNMRDMLFEICQSYANGLINLDSYTRLVERVIDRTAALHAMEVLLYQLDQRPYDRQTRAELIDLTREIVTDSEFLTIDTSDLER